MARAGGPLAGVPFSLPHSAHGGWAPAPVPLVRIPAPTAGEEAVGEEAAGEEAAGEEGAGEGTGGKAADRGAAAGNG
jgi:hypothetical protein